MSREQLLPLLSQLHALLPQEDQPDAETRRLLESVTAQIRTLLETSSDSVGTEPPASPAEQLRMTLLEFEARHPQLSGLIERIADGLSGMGI
jgi:hypothetical protein